MAHSDREESALTMGGRGARTHTRRRPRIAAVAAALVTAAATAVSMSTVAGAVPSHGSNQPDLGPDVLVFNPSMPTSQIQAEVQAIAHQQSTNQFGPERYALLFKPGTYGTPENPLVFQVGYYTEVAGLGSSPSDVVINGQIDVFDQCGLGGGDCNALVNFWRSLSNLTIDVAGDPGFGYGCYTNTEMWAVSQAAPMRRVAVNGGTFSLMDYCGHGTFGGSHYSSGGFIADSTTNDSIVNGSQQQFLVRNSSIGGWSNAVWNQVFAGVEGAPAQSFPNPPYTTLDTNPASRERPFLTIDSDGDYSVFVPAARHNSAGTTWSGGATAGRSIPLTDFFVAHPSDSVQVINEALSRGKNLLFTPGIYEIAQTIKVKRADTVVLGLGLATLEPQNGVVAMTVADSPGVDIAGIIFDAGPVNSPVLLQIGKTPGNNHRSDANDPTGVQDVFFRIGGAHVGKATFSLEVNSDNVVLDDIWAWRADHGEGVGWTSNTADSGVLVNGDNVVATGLFVEHFQKREVVWNGNRGKTIFFQNELPYDVPSQDAWNASSNQLGYPAFTVSPNVRTFDGYGMGSYVVFIQTDATIVDDMAFQSPARPGVRFNDLLAIYIGGSGGYNSVINGVGGPANSENPGNTTLVPVVSYP